MYYTEEQLQEIGFKSLGKNVKISTLTAIYTPEKMEIGDNTRIDDFCVIHGKIKFGMNVHLAVYSFVNGHDVGVIFEDFTTIAYKSMVFTASDDYLGHSMTNATVPLEYKKLIEKPVLIKRHSIVGAGSIILPGVTLETGTAVGAMSLVTKSTQEWGVYVGTPAKRISERHKNPLKLEKEYLKKLESEELKSDE